jgi:hypothetical protein
MYALDKNKDIIVWSAPENSKDKLDTSTSDDSLT